MEVICVLLSVLVSVLVVLFISRRSLLYRGSVRGWKFGSVGAAFSLCGKYARWTLRKASNFAQQKKFNISDLEL